ncbi:DUF5366 family protein [Bacillus sp. 2205SS5-2]|uniref:DUF5366 family protein n=1 Tax=Bacillus sp. 2205SS5-2 TaxID=3109031 RepID=UPI003004E34D
MKNTYITGYFPLFSILLFSLTFAVYGVDVFVSLFKGIGIYAGMREFLSDIQLNLFVLILLMTVFFMVFAALKLIAETINELSLLFFSKDSSGEAIQSVRPLALVFFIGALVSIVSVNSIVGLMLIFLASCFIYFVLFVYKITPSLSRGGMVGIVLFQVLFWSLVIVIVFFAALKIYNGILASLPILTQVKR